MRFTKIDRVAVILGCKITSSSNEEAQSAWNAFEELLPYLSLPELHVSTILASSISPNIRGQIFLGLAAGFGYSLTPLNLKKEEMMDLLYQCFSFKGDSCLQIQLIVAQSTDWKKYTDLAKRVIRNRNINPEIRKIAIEKCDWVDCVETLLEDFLRGTIAEEDLSYGKRDISKSCQILDRRLEREHRSRMKVRRFSKEEVQIFREMGRQK